MNDLQALQARYANLQSHQMSLDLTRGKPGTEQLDLCNGLDGVLEGDYTSLDGIDTRNYGGLRGIRDARLVGQRLLDIPEERVIAGGNSSLQLMYITVDQILNRGLVGSALKTRTKNIAICLVPGYDRHFHLCKYFGIEMVNAAMDENGPDMDYVETLVRDNPATSLLWCVPKHSNPTGCTFSDEVIDRLAALPKIREADPDNPFYVLCDNAYAVHDFLDSAQPLPNLDDRARYHGTQDRVIQFASTSKITFAGAGVGFIGGSEKVLAEFERAIGAISVGFDKVNQLRHARFLDYGSGVTAHMRKHAEILRPKFAAVQRALETELGNLGVATWTQPTGGYFVSLDVPSGMAKKVVQAAKDCGLALTPAGATFPYGNDPDDKNIRIAPTYATLEQVEAAMEILTVCVKLVVAKHRPSK
ncbi:MAG: aminotransferase [Gammaproteobacteria bacterium]|nr:aminotransferase [Gammaproteobacteria bacterium]